MYIYLVRHGETDWNTKLLFQGHTDIPLNKNGIKQAKCIAKELRHTSIGAVISSDLRRAVRTAEEIVNVMDPKPETEKISGLRERNYGNFEGKKYELYHSSDKNFSGENDRKFSARINSVFRDVMKKYRGKNIVIVTHGGVVRQIISYILGLKKYTALRVYNASISEIFYDEKKCVFFLLGFNSIAHLPVKQRNTAGYHIKGV
jgi:broad specificity phosphatase PhoE